jgi:hypothetical protein
MISTRWKPKAFACPKVLPFRIGISRSKAAVAIAFASRYSGASAPRQEPQRSGILSAEGRSKGEAEATDLLLLPLLLSVLHTRRPIKPPKDHFFMTL